MKLRRSAVSLATLSLVTLGLCAVPIPGLAQDTGEGAAAEVNNKVITLNLESTDIYYAFKLLFQQVKVDYTIDPSIKGTPVTVNLKQPFRQAIDLLIKSSGLPITLQIESNVYQIVPKKEEVVDPVTTDTNPEPDQPRNDRVQKIFVGTLNGIDIVSALGGRFLSFTSSFGQMGFNPFGGGMMGGGMGGMGMGGMGGGMGMGGMGMGGMGMGGMGGGMGMGGMGGGMGMGGMGMGGMGMGGMGGGMMGGFGSRGR